jgi:hypothetical protein
MTLPHNAPSLTSLPNGWWQVSFTLTLPFTLEMGARLQMGETLLAPWRINGQHIDCLALPTVDKPDATQAILLAHQGKPLPHIDGYQLLLITGENLGIADALLSAQHLKHHAKHCVVLLSGESFPCVIKPARFMVRELPELIAACPLLEDWGFANRLANNAGLAGCFEGELSHLVTQLNDNADFAYQNVTDLITDQRLA